MPALNYDYDYYEYRNGRRVGSAVPQRKSTTSTSTTYGTHRTTQTRRGVSQTSTRKGTTPLKTTNTKRKVTTNKKPIVKESATARKKATTKSKTSNIKKTNIDIPLESSRKMASKPEKMELNAPKVQVQNKTNFVSVLKNIALVSVLFSLFFMVCYRYSLINEEFSKIKSLKKDLITIQTTNEQLQADIESKTDLTYVENYAKYQLGMQKPTSSQIQYVQVEKQDKITVPVTIDEGGELNWFDKIVNEIRKIID